MVNIFVSYFLYYEISCIYICFSKFQGCKCIRAETSDGLYAKDYDPSMTANNPPKTVNYHEIIDDRDVVRDALHR